VASADIPFALFGKLIGQLDALLKLVQLQRAKPDVVLCPELALCDMAAAV
jgi:hypothetical protein